jgi:ectoine hydroxylase-related dioxygenase (phytanoyl-CoA dioxygenase family)
MIEVRKNIISQQSVDDVLRMLHTELLTNTPSTETLGRWAHTASWFWHLRWDPEIMALMDQLPMEWRGGTICDPQILLQFPSDPAAEQEPFHVDETPEWSTDTHYHSIVGVPLTRWTPQNGAVRFAKGLNNSARLNPGDAVMFSGDQPHSGGINATGSIRYGVYFRWVS